MNLSNEQIITLFKNHSDNFRFNIKEQSLLIELLDVEIHPKYQENNFIFLAYSQPKWKKAFTAIARAKLIKNQLKDLINIENDKNQFLPLMQVQKINSNF